MNITPCCVFTRLQTNEESSLISALQPRCCHCGVNLLKPGQHGRHSGEICFQRHLLKHFMPISMKFVSMDLFGVSVSIQSTGGRQTNAETSDLISPRWVNLDLMSPPDYCCGHMMILIQQLFVIHDIWALATLNLQHLTCTYLFWSGHMSF